MSRYSLSKLKFTSSYFVAMDCILNGKQAIYCSSELTSGLHLYSEMRKHKVNSPGDLKGKLGDKYQENIRDVNKDAANRFADLVACKQIDRTPVITPAPLTVPDWGQPEYYAFWEEVIRTRVKAVWFNNNWQYSSGCTFEFAVALEAEIDTLDAQGNPIEVGAAVACVEAAIAQVREFDTAKLQDHLQQLRSLAALPPANAMKHYLSPGNGSSL